MIIPLTDKTMESKMGTAAMPIVLDQQDGQDPPAGTGGQQGPQGGAMDPSLLLMASMQDYSAMCKRPNKHSDSVKPSERSNWLILPKEKTESLVLAERASVHIAKPPTHTYFIKVNGGPRCGKKRTRRKKQVVCFTCSFCPLMTLNREMMALHGERDGACAADCVRLRCPGCPNVFFSTVSLRVHLAHDHNMVSKDVKRILQNLPRVTVTPDLKSSCVYNSSQPSVTDEGAFEERSSCANVKRPTTLLETYLDDIGDKSHPTLSQTGQDLLENTFNFTAPVSEQLPSIQPENPPPASGLDKEHLLEESTQIMDNMDTNTQLERAPSIEHQLLIPTPQVRCEELEGGGREGVAKEGETDHPHNHFLTITNVFPNEETYSEEPLEEYVYIDGEMSVVRLDDKHGVEQFEFVSCEEKVHSVHTEVHSVHTEVQSVHIDRTVSAQTAPSVTDDKANVKKIGCGYRCDINGCKFRMQSEDNIKYHRRCHEGQLYNCPECCKDCPNWVSLSSHLWQKHKIDMELFQCDLCPYRTPSYSRLTSIHRGIHGTSRPFLCDSCGKGFKTVKQMRNHKMIHKAKMVRASCSLDCAVCGRSFVNKRSLEQHVRNLHSKLKPYLCSTCGYATAAKHSLVVHIRKHTGEKPHQCDKCGYQTADHNALRRHRMKHSGEANYKCSHCPYTCIQASSFKIHLKQKHPGLEQELIFSCQHCAFETLQRGKYLAHVAQHTGAADPLAYYPVPTAPISVVDLSSAHSLLQDGYFEVDEIAGTNLEQGEQ